MMNTILTNWKHNRLYFGGISTRFSVVPDQKYPKQYRVRWPDKVLSADHYNLAWAKQHCEDKYFNRASIDNTLFKAA